MLDTDTLIYLMKNRPVSVAERVDALDDGDLLCMSYVTFAELLAGAERSTRRAQVSRQLERLIAEIPVMYDASRALCEQYAQQHPRLRAAGTPIGGNDLWIACHAIAIDATLVTNNQREFGRILGLRTENWVR
jgi:tRNA(fMet)-specific endonuclease VapC